MCILANNDVLSFETCRQQKQLAENVVQTTERACRMRNLYTHTRPIVFKSLEAQSLVELLEIKNHIFYSSSSTFPKW